MVTLLVNADDEEQNLRNKIGDVEDFDLQLAEHRTRALEKELGLDVVRVGKDIYSTGGQFMIEMNLHNASRPLMNLIEKVENTLLSSGPSDDKLKKKKTVRANYQRMHTVASLAKANLAKQKIADRKRYEVKASGRIEEEEQLSSSSQEASQMNLSVS